MILSIEISSKLMHIVELANKGVGGKKLAVTRFAAVDVPQGAVANGAAANVTMLSDALKEALAANGFKAKRTLITITSPRIAFHELVVQKRSFKRLESTLSERAHELSFLKNDTVMDYVVLEETGAGKDAQTRALCAMSPISLIDGYRDAAVRAGLKPVRLDVSANAAHRLYMSSEELDKTKPVVFAGIHDDMISLALFSGVNRRFYRVAPISYPVSNVDNEFILSSRFSEESSAAMQQDRLITTCVDQLSKLVQFQSIQNRELPVERIVLASDRASTPGLKEAVESALEIAVPDVAVPACVSVPDGFGFDEYMFAVAAGLRL